jgi:hypothetical protein
MRIIAKSGTMAGGGQRKGGVGELGPRGGVGRTGSEGGVGRRDLVARIKSTGVEAVFSETSLMIRHNTRTIVTSLGGSDGS